jgi:hypothetical protein
VPEGRMRGSLAASAARNPTAKRPRVRRDLPIGTQRLRLRLQFAGSGCSVCRVGGGIRPRVSDRPTISPARRQRGEGRSVRGQFVAVRRYTFARIRFFRSSSVTSLARA